MNRLCSRHLILVALSAAMTLGCQGSTAPTETLAQGAAPPNLSNFQLRPATNQDDLMNRVLQLDGQLPKPGVQNILDTANLQAVQSTTSSTCNPDAVNTLMLHGVSYCFEPADNGSAGNENIEWWPQGITTVADAQADPQWGGHPERTSCRHWRGRLVPLAQA